jgi:hypothetical protein
VLQPPNHDSATRGLVALQNGLTDNRPDIYYIILDGYGRADILKDFYGFDNSSLLTDLRQRGFYVADNSQANYCQTYLSLASTLNMCYLGNGDMMPHRVPFPGPNSNDRAPLENSLANNIVTARLRQMGYRIVTFATGYGGTDFMNADVRLGPAGALTEFQRVWLSMTALAPILFERLDAASHRARTLYCFDHLGKGDIPALRGVPFPQIHPPVFVFAHILAAHQPFVFGENGEKVAPRNYLRLFSDSVSPAIRERELKQYRSAYSRQLKYINRRLVETITRILDR